MSINVNVGNFIPTNVVEVGNEISVNQLAAITAADTPSSTNPFSTASHIHTIANVSGLQTALDGKSATTHLHAGVYSPVGHSHVISDVAGLQTSLDGKSDTTHLHTGVYAPVAHSHVIGDITGLQTALDGKASSTHNHDSAYAPLVHTHSIANITGLQTAIDSKANLSGATFTGRIGVGVAPDAVAALKVSSGGIMFNDGTVITTAPTGGGGGGAVTSVAGKTGAVVLNTADITGLQTTLNGKASLSGDTFTGTVHVPTLRNILNTDLEIVAYNDTGAGTTFTHKFDAYNGRLLLAPNGDGLTFPDGTSQTTAGIPLTGGIFTGKVDFTSTNGAAGLNIGIGGTNTNATTAGDLWITTGGASINYRDGNGTWRILPALNNANVFSANQVVAAATTGALLRITQTGTGNALVVEDTNNPDTTPFVIDANGRVGVGVAPSTTAAIKVDAGGIMFNDGTTLTTAPVGGGGAVWGGITGTLASQTDLNTALNGKANLSGATFTGAVSATSFSTSGSINMTGTGQLNNINGQINGLQVNATGNLTGNNVIANNNMTTPALRITQIGNSPPLIVEDSANPDVTSFVVAANGSIGMGVDSTFTSTRKLEVQGNVLVNGLLDLASQTTQAHTNAFTTYNQEIKVNINGVDRWIPVR